VARAVLRCIKPAFTQRRHQRRQCAGGGVECQYQPQHAAARQAEAVGFVGADTELHPLRQAVGNLVANVFQAAPSLIRTLCGGCRVEVVSGWRARLGMQAFTAAASQQSRLKLRLSDMDKRAPG
jgi:hypothetical protein